MTIPSRTFNANEGDESRNTAGPDQIEHDLDNLFAVINPNTTQKDGSPGGLSDENIRPSSITEKSIHIDPAMVTDVAIAAHMAEDGTTAHGGTADTVDGMDFRIDPVMGFQYSLDGGTVWKDVGALPTKLRTSDFSQASPVQNQWYTVLNVTGVGILSRISATSESGSGGYDNNYTDISITVDGTEYIFDISNKLISRGLGGDGTFKKDDCVDILSQVRFNSSLVVKARNTYSSVAVALYCSVDYGLF